MGRINIIVLDSFGVGELPDAHEYGDEGSNTLEGIYNNYKLNLPKLKKLGLYNIVGLNIPEKEENPIGCFGKATEISKGKNSPIGHWEMSGAITEVAFSTFPNGFPKDLLEKVSKEANIPGFICNEKGSGTDLLKKYGEESVKTKKPIVYTSADSVFQIAAHEDVYPIDELYRICKVARKVIDKGNYNIGTVIARPFVGTANDNYKRTYNRKDFEATTFSKTMLDVLNENGRTVYAIGKIEDLFVGRGITDSVHTEGNADGIEKNILALKNSNYDLIFTNLVDFDMLYGHRNDVEGYGKALEYFDSKLPEIIKNLKQDDILIITADHGCDPSTPSTDHSREYIPVIVYGKSLKSNIDLGIRKTYADISATVLDYFDLENLKYGTSFKNEII